MAKTKPVAKSAVKAKPAPKAIALIPTKPVAGPEIEDMGFGEIAEIPDVASVVDTAGNTSYGKPQSAASIMARLKSRGIKSRHIGGTLPPAFPASPDAGACRLIVPLDIEHISKEDGGGSEFDVLVCDVVTLPEEGDPFIEYRAQIGLSKGLDETFALDGKRATDFTDSDGEAHDLGWGSQVYAVTYAGQLAGKGTKAGLKLWRVEILDGLTFGD